MSALEKALVHSKNLGIDECEVVHIKRKITTIRITDSEIYELKQNKDENFGVRIIHNKKITSFQTSKDSEITKSIDASYHTTSYLRSREFWKSLPYEIKSKVKLKGVYDKKLYEISGSDAADIAQNIINSCQSKKINAISGSLNIVSEIFEIANSNGLFENDKATYISGVINADSQYAELEVSGIGHGCCRTLDKFSPEQIGTDAKKMCIDSINPKRVESGEYAIIFEPYSVGEILAFVMSPNFNFKTLTEKKSCFSKSFKEKIATDDFSLIDNPHISQGLGTKPFDEEGIQTSINVLVNKGVFENTFRDLYDSYKENLDTTGNASRPGSPMGRSAESVPTSLPHNMQVKPGNTSQEEMIKETKKGVLVGRLWYTYSVNPIKGDFSCTARSGIRIIENGEIKSPGKPVRIIHSLPRLLQNISTIGKNEKNVIQWASLSSITPSIKAEKIKVDSI